MSVKLFPLTSTNILSVKSKETVTAPNGKASLGEFVFQLPKTIPVKRSEAQKQADLFVHHLRRLAGMRRKSPVNEGHVLSYLILAADA